MALRRTWIPVIVLAEVVAVAGFITNRGWGPRPMLVRPPTLQSSHNPRLDPALGRPAPRLPATDISGDTVDLAAPGPRPRLLALLSSCTDCSVARVAELRRAAPAGHLGLCVLFPAAARADIGSAAKSLAGCDITFEADARASQAYNATWRPRAYLLTRAGTLAASQAPTETLTAFVRRAAPLITAAAGPAQPIHTPRRERLR